MNNLELIPLLYSGFDKLTFRKYRSVVRYRNTLLWLDMQLVQYLLDAKRSLERVGFSIY